MGENESRFASLRVKDYMSPAPETLTPEDHLLNADLRIRRAGVRHLPVVNDGRLVGLHSQRLGCLPVMDGQQLVGIITRADLLRFANDALSGAR